MSGPTGGLDVRLFYPVHSTLQLDISLRLGDEIGILFGASGAGKTTLLRLIAGLARARQGRIELEGITLFDSESGIDQPLRRRQISMIFQIGRAHV